MILTISIGSQAVFLIIIIVVGHPLVSLNLLDVLLNRLCRVRILQVFCAKV